jgi:hypothetical protein
MLCRPNVGSALVHAAYVDTSGCVCADAHECSRARTVSVHACQSSASNNAISVILRARSVAYAGNGIVKYVRAPWGEACVRGAGGTLVFEV